MPRILRNLRIDDVSSVDAGAGKGVRVVLTKRHSDVSDAVRALDMSIRSIVDDDDVVDKRAAVAESLGEFEHYVRENGIDLDAAAADGRIRQSSPPLRRLLRR